VVPGLRRPRRQTHPTVSIAPLGTHGHGQGRNSQPATADQRRTEHPRPSPDGGAVAVGYTEQGTDMEDLLPGCSPTPAPARARLPAALRLPAGEDGGELSRPQRRGGARGAYGVRAVS